MRIGRATNDLNWNYGIAFEKDMSRGEGYVFAIWCFRLKMRKQPGIDALPPHVGFSWNFHIL